MSFSYSKDPSSSRLDAIRFTTGDTSSKEYLLSDEEIYWIMETYTDENKQLAVAFRQCTNVLAMRPTKRKLGPQEEATADRLAYFKAQADKYEKALSYSGTPPLPDYQEDKVFEKGMMGNV